MAVLVLGDGAGDRVGAVGEGSEFGDAHGAVPEDGGGVGDLCGEELDGLGADVEGHEFCGEGTVAGEDLRFGVGGELVGEDVVDGKEELHAFALWPSASAARGDVDLVELRSATCRSSGPGR